MTEFKQDIFSSSHGFKIEEATGVVDGQNVIAKITGPFFVPDGKSRNERFYTKQLWEKQLARPNVQSYLKEGRMYGTIGHKQPIDDQAMLDGKISHIIKDLQIEKDGVPGYGEALIFGTPAGKILNTVMRGGGKMFTSSRAQGKFGGKTEDGTPIVDEDSYNLRTFDFVIDPGFLQANPSISESLDEVYGEINENDKPKNNEGDDFMSEALLKKSMDEAANLRSDLNKALTVVNENKTVLDIQAKELTSLREQAKLLEDYKKLGPTAGLVKAQDDLKKANEQLAKLKDYGTPDQCVKAMDVATARLKEYNEMGTPTQIKDALAKAKALLLEYKPLGTPTKIDRCLEKFKTIVANFTKNENAKKIKALATELSVSEDAVAKVFNTMKVEEIRKFFKEVREQDDNSNRYRKTGTTTAAVTETAAGASELPWLKGGRGARLMESLGGGAQFGEEVQRING